MINSEDSQANNTYIIGDLLWAKIGNHPFWPCMVSYDPYEACYKKFKKIIHGKELIYHVQYFGRLVQHGWTTPGLIFPFEGENKFYEKKQRLIEGSVGASVKKNIEAKYSVPMKCKKLWDIAVSEAEEALNYSIHERYENFVFKYEYNSKNSTNGIGNSHVKRSAEVNEYVNNLPPKRMKVTCTSNNLCKICETTGADLPCNGYCNESFHKECLGLLYIPESFQCINCENGVYACFSCKKYDISLIKCVKCFKFFHEKCLEKYPCSKLKKNICPLHTCLTCYNENMTKASRKSILVECSECLTAFHNTETCIPSGSLLDNSTFLCPEHFLGMKKLSPQRAFNVPYCVVCFDGGQLICCESCPNSYHEKCLDSNIPEEEFFCESCLKKQYLYPGMIVWAKIGKFRCWPAEVLHYDDLPPNIKNLKRYKGEFPVRFFGSFDYCWTHRGRVVPYAEHCKYYNRVTSNCGKRDLVFKKSLEEAAKAYENYIQQKLEQKSDKPEPYRHIRVNKAIPPATIFIHDAKAMLSCNCDPNEPNPCSIDSLCLNRSLSIECHPDVCKAKEKCENQKFQRRQYASVKIVKTKNTGWGLQSLEPIKKGSFVIEYVGEVITHEEYRKRSLMMKEKNIQNFYFLYIDAQRMIDAGPRGNLSRFINHSCNPNCEMMKWSVNGDCRIGIFALTDIEPGEELTFNYQADYIEFEQRCHCGSPNCQGFIGRKPNGKKKVVNKTFVLNYSLYNLYILYIL